MAPDTPNVRRSPGNPAPASSVRIGERTRMPQPVQYRGMNLVIPDNDSEFKEYFQHARQHRLMMRACTACGLMRYPPTQACPWCTELGWKWQEVSGRGTI